jgi:hypothetical protein
MNVRNYRMNLYSAFSSKIKFLADQFSIIRVDVGRRAARALLVLENIVQVKKKQGVPKG